MATEFTEWYDLTAGSATLAAGIDTLSPGANKRIGHIKLGSRVRFYVYDVA